VPDLGNGNAQLAASVEFDLSVCGVECLNFANQLLASAAVDLPCQPLYLSGGTHFGVESPGRIELVPRAVSALPRSCARRARHSCTHGWYRRAPVSSVSFWARNSACSTHTSASESVRRSWVRASARFARISWHLECRAHAAVTAARASCSA
jgi:hypothetical protein